MAGEILREDRSDPQPVRWRSAKQLIDTRGPGARTEAEAEIASRMEQARRDGYANGVAAARHQAEQELLPAIQKEAGAVVELARLRDRIREQATADIVQLAIAMASRVVHREIAVDLDVLAGLLRAAFSKLQATEIARVRVHPEFEPILRRCLEQKGAAGNLLLVTDRGIKPGAVEFELDVKGDVSAEADLSEIERGLSDKIGPAA